MYVMLILVLRDRGYPRVESLRGGAWVRGGIHANVSESGGFVGNLGVH